MKYRKLKSLKFLYEINELGEIRNVKSKKIIKPYKENNGYMRVSFENKCLGGKIRSSVHQLLAEAFIQNTENKPFINHKNSVRDDNRLENLEWCTHSENIKHSFDKGLTVPPLQNKKVFLKETESTYSSITELAKDFFINGKGKNISSNISYASSVLNGRRKKFFGLTLDFI